MKIIFKILNKIKNFLLLLICLFVFLFQGNSQILNALSMDNYKNQIVIEELRLKVPKELKEVWISAEKKNLGALVIYPRWFYGKTNFLGQRKRRGSYFG